MPHRISTATDGRAVMTEDNTMTVAAAAALAIATTDVIICTRLQNETLAAHCANKRP